MKFRKAIRMKKMVDIFNQNRCEGGSAAIYFRCSMYSTGHWSVDLCFGRKGCFYSHEVEKIIDFCRYYEISFFIGSNLNGPVLYLQ